MTQQVRAPMSGIEAALIGGAVEVATPAFVYDPQLIMERYSSLRAALGRALVVSVKANFDATLFSRLASHFSDGIELASFGELRRAVGRYKGTKYINVPALPAESWASAAAAACTLVVGSSDQLEAILALKAQRNVRLGDVMIRLHAASLAGRQWDWRRDDHFGVSPEEAAAMCRRAGQAGLTLRGFHVFSGSNTFPHGVTSVLASLRQFLHTHGQAPAVQTSPQVLMGLGLPDEAAPEASLRGLAAEVMAALPGADVRFECGRAIFAQAGAFVTRVQSVKYLGDRWVVTCDGGLPQAFLLACTETFTRPVARPRLIRAQGRAQAAPNVHAEHAGGVYVGPSCNRQDVIGLLDPGAEVPALGDLVVFGNAGAYVSTYTPVNFLCAEPAQAYIVNA